ncbi:MAG: DUF4430 domain-containing protein [Clostridia bacterium]|nr:DUF4430 domain-containing protein [Clostridia bacterium]
MKITKRILALLLALLLVIACFASCQAKKTDDKGDVSSVQGEEISITVDIVKDGKTKNLIIKTDEKYLANALAEAGVIEYTEDGLYTTVDGITADYNKDGAWWCVTKSGEMTTKGMNDLELKNGDKYEITYTK